MEGVMRAYAETTSGGTATPSSDRGETAVLMVTASGARAGSFNLSRPHRAPTGRPRSCGVGEVGKSFIAAPWRIGWRHPPGYGGGGARPGPPQVEPGVHVQTEVP